MFNSDDLFESILILFQMAVVCREYARYLAKRKRFGRVSNNGLPPYHSREISESLQQSTREGVGEAV